MEISDSAKIKQKVNKTEIGFLNMLISFIDSTSLNINTF